jgi:hypothetical protein
MDSCKYTILEEFPRCVGKTTAVTQYIEWEFIHSPTAMNFHVSPHLLERYGTEYFDTLRSHYFKGRSCEHAKTGSMIIPYTENIDNILSRNSIPHVIFIDIRFNMDKFFYIHDAIESMKGKRITSYQSTYMDYYNKGIQPRELQYTDTLYDGARYIITAQDAYKVVKYLLSRNVEEDDIGYIAQDCFERVGRGYYGSSQMDAATIYAPYIPNFTHPTHAYPP